MLLLGMLRRERHGIAGIGFESALVLLLYAALGGPPVHVRPVCGEPAGRWHPHRRRPPSPRAASAGSGTGTAPRPTSAKIAAAIDERRVDQLLEVLLAPGLEDADHAPRATAR